MDEAIRWINLSHNKIVEKLKEQGLTVSTEVVAQLLKKHGFRPRQAFKTEAGKRILLNVMNNLKILKDLKKNILMLEIQY